MGAEINVEGTWARSPARWRAGAWLYLAYVATATASVLFIRYWVDPALRTSEVAVPWLAVGIGVAGVQLGGARLWPALFLGSWTVWGLWVHDSPLTVTVDAAAEAASIVLIARLLSAWGFERGFGRFRDPLLLLAAAALGRLLAAAVDCLGGVLAVLWAPQTLPPAHLALLTDAGGAAPRLTAALLGASLRWGLNTIAGVVLVVPLLAADAAQLRGALRGQALPAAGALLALLAWCAAALAAPQWAGMPLLIAALLLVTWTASRFGVGLAALATLVMSMVAALGCGLRLGPLSSGDPRADIEVLWGFIALLVVTGMVMAVLLAGRRRELERLGARARRNMQLFRNNPSPLWVADAATGRILLVNDQAQRSYGYSEAEFLARTTEELAVGPARTEEPPAAGEEVTRARKHRTRSGKLIDVEVQETPIELDGRPALLCHAVDVSDRHALRVQLLSAADVERRRLAQELHDGLGQVLTALNLGAQGAALRAARGGAVEAGTVDFLVKSSVEAISLCQELTRGVSPLEHADGDLLEALRRLPDSLPPPARGRLEVRVEARAALALSRPRAEHLYRVVQEAVSNAVKHAAATRIRVGIEITPETVAVEVEDDGVGMAAGAGPLAGLGLRSMSLRAAAVGGDLELDARPGGGTRVRCACPQHEPPTAEADDEAGAGAGAAAPAAPPAAVAAVAAPWRRWRQALAYGGECLLVAALCFGALAASTLLAQVVDPSVAMYGARLAVPSLLSGISVAVLVLRGGRLWPGIGAGALLGAGLLIPLPWPYTIYYGAQAAFVALIAYWLLVRWGFGRGFDRWRDPLLLLGAAVAADSASAVLGFAGVLTYQSLRPGEFGAGMTALITDPSGTTPVVTSAFLAALGRWWADGVAGTVLVVPVLAATPPLSRALRERPAEVAIWCLALLGWMAGMFLLDDAGARWPLATLALMLLIWAVGRFGVAWAFATSFACATAATVSFALQRGVLATMGAHEGVSALWSFLALLTVTGMFLTALLAERNRIRDQVARSATRYQRLFDSDPHPLWVQERDSGRIVMVNEQAVRHYGYTRSEWLAMTADQLAAEPGAPARGAAPSPGAPVATRHRLRSGALIDVELSYAAIDTDGGPALLCFAVDVTERNSLRRGFLEATDVERRRLAERLGAGLGQALAELEQAAMRFQAVAATGRHDPAAVELVARASHRAARACRETAHGASPLQANNGDLLEALLALPEQLPSPATAQVDVEVHGQAAITLPLEKCEHLYGLVRSAVADAAENAGARVIVVRVDIEPALVRVAIEDDGRADREPAQARLPALRMMTLRATSMGARLHHSPRQPGGRTIVCECPQPATAA